MVPVLYANAYPLTFAGSVSMWRVARGPTDDKRALEGQLGVPLWGEGDAFWSTTEPSGEQSS